MQLDFDYHKQTMKVPRWFAQWFNSLDKEVNGIQRYTYAIGKVMYSKILPWYPCNVGIRALDHEDTFWFKDTNKKAERYFQCHKGYLLKALINKSLLSDFKTDELSVLDATTKQELLKIVQLYQDPHLFTGEVYLITTVMWGNPELIVRDMGSVKANNFKQVVRSYFMVCMAYLLAADTNIGKKEEN